ncbi:MAG: LPS export ABC transporter periplasmic protein LptC [Bacteroidetes bacterium]|jgi:LPS export ABC transporter protein LptC|nr:LPS export ABC transporter periplasmic protein LptC [Bacteroidota bacterium]
MRKVLVWLGLGLGLIACSNNLQEVIPLPQSNNIPLLVTKDFVLAYSDSGKQRFEMKAPLREIFGGENPRSQMPQGLNMRFLDGQGRVISSLSADSAVMFEKTSIIRASGSVVVTNPKGDTLKTTVLYWKEMPNKEGEITCPEEVGIRSGNQLIRGLGMRANLDFTEYQFLVPVGSFVVNE